MSIAKTLPDSWLDDLAYLISTHLSETVYKGAFPSNDREGICIYPTGGRLINSEFGRRKNIQVVCRNESFQTANLNAHRVFSYLNAAGNHSHGSFCLMYGRGTQEPSSIGKNEVGLVRIVCNYELFCRELA